MVIMNLTKHKTSIGKHLFALFGWIGFLVLILLFLIMSFKNNIDANVIGIIFLPIYILFFLVLLGISLIVYIIELINDYKIKNKFFLENKIYNVFWITGIIFSLLFILSIALGCFYIIYIIIISL